MQDINAHANVMPHKHGKLLWWDFKMEQFCISSFIHVVMPRHEEKQYRFKWMRICVFVKEQFYFKKTTSQINFNRNNLSAVEIKIKLNPPFVVLREGKTLFRSIHSNCFKTSPLYGLMPFNFYILRMVVCIWKAIVTFSVFCIVNYSFCL